MKSVGEAMSIGRSFLAALQKAMRSLEQTPGAFWTAPDPAGTAQDALDLARTPHDGRLHTVERALRLGATPEQVVEATGIDPWFVDQLLQLVELRVLLETGDLSEPLLRKANCCLFTRIYSKRQFVPKCRSNQLHCAI